jgi:ubiquinone/menaquinone biosynthesis C-methylase UbiE
MNLLLPFVRWFERRLYTRFAWTYDVVAWFVSLGQWTRWQAVGIDLLPQGRILEIGHGPGHVLTRLLRQGRAAIGLDASPQMSRRASRRLARLGLARPLLRAQAQSIPLARETFEGVISTFPSAYILDPRTAAEAWRVLRPGGSWVIVPSTVITGRSLPDRAAAWLNRVTAQSGDLPEGWRSAFEQPGFTVSFDRIHLPRADVFCITARKPRG